MIKKYTCIVQLISYRPTKASQATLHESSISTLSANNIFKWLIHIFSNLENVSNRQINLKSLTFKHGHYVYGRLDKLQSPLVYSSPPGIRFIRYQDFKRAALISSFIYMTINSVRFLRYSSSIMDWKVFNDSIHGHMSFHPLIVSIIDTPQFQRLRNLKQLGLAYFVYPTACHNRFEHSLGTCHLAGKLLEALNRNRPRPETQEEIAEREKEKLCVQIAGLCHDLGHGPFSHTWELFLERVGKSWKHEECSIEVFDMILAEKVTDKQSETGDKKSVLELFRKYGLENEIETIKHLIRGTKPVKNPPKYFLYQIINNKDNDIDVDKWDYLSRDKALLNLNVSFDHLRLLEYCQILEVDGKEQICYRKKECSNIIDMFITRGMMHDKAYQHVKVKIIEEMVLDAFSHAKEKLNLTDCDTRNILKLTDHIYYKIIHDDSHGDEGFQNAKEILLRVQKRDLYLCIANVEIKGTQKINQAWLKILGDKIYSGLKFYHDTLNRDDIKVTKIEIDMTPANKRPNKPLQNVYVFDKKKIGEKMSKAERFDWENFRHTIKPNFQNFFRREILILYKGNDRLKFTDQVSTESVLRAVKEMDIE